MPVVSLTWVEDEGCSLAASRCELLGCCSLAASIWELLCCSLAASRCELLGCSLAASRWAIGWSLAASRCETVCWSLAASWRGLQLRSLKQNKKLADFPVARHWTNQSKIILKFWFLNTAVFKETVSHRSFIFPEAHGRGRGWSRAAGGGVTAYLHHLLLFLRKHNRAF